MCPHGQATDRVDELDAIARLESETFEIGWPAAADESIEGLVDGLDVAGLEQRLGHVRSTDTALAGNLKDAFQANRRAEPPQGLNHLLGPLQACIPETS